VTVGCLLLLRHLLLVQCQHALPVQSFIFYAFTLALLCVRWSAVCAHRDLAATVAIAGWAWK